MKKLLKPRWNLLDLFLLMLVALAVFSFYFSFFKPIQFSNLIQREGVNQYAEAEIILSKDLGWMKNVLPVGEKSKNVYGDIDWEILEVKEEMLGGEKWTIIKAKILIVKESSGTLRYGKYTLVTGSHIFLINDNFFLEGRLRGFRLLDERIPI